MAVVFLAYLQALCDPDNCTANCLCPDGQACSSGKCKVREGLHVALGSFRPALLRAML